MRTSITNCGRIFTNFLIMKYKLLKQFDKESIPVWDTFDMQDATMCELGFDWTNVSLAWLVKEWYIEQIEDKINPEFFVWEKVIYEYKNLVFFAEIKGIRILDWEIMYYLFDWFYKEENIKRASKECQNKNSKFYWVYPF